MRSYQFRSRLTALCIGVCFISSVIAQFSPGNLVVLQAGDGSSPLANTGNRIVLREFTPAGTAAFSVAITSTATPLILAGTASSEGMLSCSANGKYLVFAGYCTNPPYASALNAATASTLNRGVGRVTAAGVYSRVAMSSSFFSTTNIRGASSDGLNNYWACGGNGGGSGTAYFGTTAATVLVQNATPNTRFVDTHNGNLLFSTASATPGIIRVGTGLPTTSGQATTQVISCAGTGSGTPSPYGFYFNATETLCYIADDRSFSNGGGVQKWSFTNGAWSFQYNLSVGGSAGARAVVVDFSGTLPRIYATTDETSANRLVAISDGGAASTATTLVTAPANTAFRGLAFSPYCLEPQVNSITNSPACTGGSVALTASVSGWAPISYSWTSPAQALSNGTSALFPAAAGLYTLSLSNSCGSVSVTHSVTVYPVPAITVTPLPAFICPGGTATISATGAASYSWSNGASGSSFTASPGSTTVYTLTGLSAQGCAASVVVPLVVTESLQVSANPVNVCPGTAGLLVANGASSYIWSTGGAGSTQTVMISVPTVYTVTGSAPGCTAVSVATVLASIAPQPTLSISATSVCAGTTATLSAYGAMNYSWTIPATGPLVFATPSVTTVYTVNAVSVDGCTATAHATVLVAANPQATISVPSLTYCLSGPSQTLSGSPAGGYFTGPGVSANQFNPALAGTGTLSATYTYVDGNGCAGSDSAVLSVLSCTATAIGENAGQAGLLVYPVPAGDLLYISDPSGSDAVVEVYVADGRRLCGTRLLEGQGRIDIAQLQPGVYLLRLNARVVRFVKD